VSTTSTPSATNDWKVHFAIKSDWFARVLVRPTVPRPVNLRGSSAGDASM
jgi:hypothetical protein